jgi:predicted flap endonuclease-1-like 5' DNA nuclease
MKSMNKLIITLVLLYLVWRWLNQPPLARTTMDFEDRQQPYYPAAAKEQGPGPRSEDDLTKIKGIGLKASSALKRGGIHTFEQLASLDAEHIKAILGAYGLRSLDPTTWPEQAANVAKSS